ncbi:MAG TPA: GlsB/YeaQ/YmgE family stress response membrane protein [Longimicrobiales bacterium]|jgi:uncharacterized membrane protein YeaQ/YmgE (transglycosylase-associated protein family)|nr:GlsB/YeaQ/YmgE family stress response membrane protein [Longimicrobiales bacterium]
MFFIGLLVWLIIGLAGGVLARALYAAPDTEPALTIVFGVFGAFIGGMLGLSGYVHHDANPMRFGGLLGAALGAILFAMIYHVAQRKAT